MADAEPPKRRQCGTMHVHHRLLATSPRYAEARQRIEEQAFRVEMGMAAAARPGCTEIPVVVHVVHKTPAQNISQAQIDSQIKVLNEDFRKQNADVANTPAPFAPLAADSRIQFKLATTDPSGNPTDGIVRKRTDRDGFNDNDDVKSDATGGSTAWPADQYLNMWVCQLTGGLLGYAQFPGGPAATDGVVITHTAFGTTGTAAPPFNLGRTATHEVGHWLNLRHIWGDDGDGCGGSDFVADTPNQGGSNFGAPTFPTISCNNGPNGDMFMNYMDYVDDIAMVMFTQGQASRMQAALDGPRAMIGSNIPCVGAKIPVKDTPKDAIKEGPKDQPKDLVKETPKDIPKDVIKEPPKDLPKDPPKDFPKDPPKEFPKDPPKEFPKDPPKDFPKDNPKDLVKEPPKDLPKDPPKDLPKDPPKDFPKDPPKEFPKDPPKDFPKDNPKDLIKEPPKEGHKDFPKDAIKDGPKDNPKDLVKEAIHDPQKDVFETPIDWPKSALEPPIDLPGIPGGPGGTPFVLATGQAAAAAAQQARAQAAASYQVLLSHYAQLHRRGMLDAQGLEGWRQAWAAYRQLGGA
ncbi:hypothetical protein MesoLjLc_16910 [Mesorhizobium sp. L-8-10]|uniref:zinc metalloprotease n=1 Tax=Mesorhizobium sp. L-8-10 TaxID=2744523 RepID=UPI00193644C5|nr:zinc metalloprotease [Mesorhizobium sp. L-8-10]BCH29761.1 hypothetical protein MesoLjLc_16910 [Mesorhizobium sp. L-8-10]